MKNGSWRLVNLLHREPLAKFLIKKCYTRIFFWSSDTEIGASVDNGLEKTTGGTHIFQNIIRTFVFISAFR